MSNIEKAAKMAGEWWAARLSQKYADRREAFASAIEKRVLQELRGEAFWDWLGKRHEGNGVPQRHALIENDYSPCYSLKDALDEALKGVPQNERARALPAKCFMIVRPDRLCPKEGYGKYMADILVY